MFFDTKEVEWNDVRVLVAGSRLVKLDGIEFGIASNKAHLFGEGDKPLGIQSGDRTPTGTLKLKKGALDDMNNAALAAGGRDVNDLEFDIVVVYQPAKNRPLRTRTLIGCQVSDYKESMDRGALEMPVSLPFLFLDVK